MMIKSEIDELYAEVPLESGSLSTRILELERRLDDSDADLVNCTLRAFSAEEAEEYEALSYFWGDKAATKPVRVNEKSLNVTSNLEKALRHLRRSSERRLLWVDAICINQSDVTERSAQVSRMHTIYQRAKRTIAWLGDGGDDGELAIEFLQWYAGRKMMLQPVDVDGRSPEYEEAGWTAVSKLMKRPYWRRLWVMQELALSRGVPSLACGRKRLSWKLVIAALEDYRLSYFVTRLNRVRGAVHKMQARKSKDQPNRNGGHLIFLLSHSAAFETSEPRDRVYALYGLLRVSGVVDFIPDYSMTIAEVYEQITSFVISSKGGLDVLELKPWNQDPSLPSWVVDLSSTPSFQLPTSTARPWQRKDVEPEPAVNSLSHLSLAEAEAVSKSTALSVSGAVIDEVSAVDTVHSCVRLAFATAEFTEFNKSGNKSARIPEDGADLKEYWLSSANDEVVNHHSGELCVDVVTFFQQWDPLLQLFRDKGDEIWYPSSWDLTQMLREAPARGEPASSFQNRYGESMKPILNKLSLMLHGRHLFQTKGGFFGVGLAGIHPGDQVVAFQSTKQLHVLRKAGESYMYVGAAILADPSNDLDRNASSNKPSERLQKLYKAVRDGDIADQAMVVV